MILQVQQISTALVIIPKRKTWLIERALTTTAKAVPITTIKIIIIERILIALKHKESNKDRYYKLCQ